MTQIIRNAVHLRRKVILYACNTDTHWVFTHLLYAHLSHNRLYLHEILYRHFGLLCVYLSTENWSRAVWELKKWSVCERERERESTSISAIPPITPSITKLIDNELWLPGKTRRLITQFLTLQVLRPLFQITSSCFGSLSVHCGCHTETRYANVPHPMTETHILKDKTVNLAYRMYFECPVVLK